MRILVGVICCFLLASAYIVSHSLLNDVSVPAAEITRSAPAPTPQAVTPALHEPEVTQAVAHAPAPATPAPAPAAVPLDTRLPPATPATPAFTDEVAESPFGEHSQELEYAEMYVNEAGSDQEQLLLARQVFERCLEQEPNNKRCSVGIHRSNTRLSLGKTQENAPVLPMLTNEKQHMVKHHLQRGAKHLFREMEPK